jgi:outer membrane protein TolC
MKRDAEAVGMRWNDLVGTHGALAVAIVVAGAAGCATRGPLPIDDALVEALRRPQVEEGRFAPATSERVRAQLPPVPINLADGLTPDEAALVAVAVNPELAAIRDNRGIQHSQVTQAGILPNPTFTGGADFTTDGQMPMTTYQTAYGLGLTWNLSPILSLPTAIEAETLGLEAVELDIAWQEWQVAQAARLAAGRLVFLRRRLTIAEQTEHAFTEQTQTLSAALDQHNATVLEVGTAQAAQQQATLDRLQVLQLFRTARLDLLTALGVPPTSTLEADFNTTPPSWTNRPTLEALIDTLPTQRLDLLALQRGYRSQDARVRTQTIRAFPPVVIGVGRSTDSSGVGIVGFTVSIDLPFFDRNQGNIELASATQAQLYDEYLARVQNARFDVANALVNLTSLGEQVALLQAYVPSLEHQIEMAAEEVGRGNVSLIDLYDLRVRLLNAQLSLVQLQQTEFELGVALDIAAGVMLNDRTSAATPEDAPATTTVAPTAGATP